MKAAVLFGPGPRPWRRVVGVLALFVLLAGIARYISHVQHESERKWCSIVTTLDDAYRSTPPTTPIGRKIAADFAQLRRDLHC